MNERKRASVLLFKGPALVWAIVIFIAIAMPSRDIPRIHFWTFGIEFDKFIHGSLFFVQASLIWFGLVNARALPLVKTHPVITAILVSMTYGALTELYQLMTPDRSSDVLDFLADSIGAGIFGMLVISGAADRILSGIKKILNV